MDRSHMSLFALFSFGPLFFRLSTVYFIRLRILFDPNDLNSKIENLAAREDDLPKNWKKIHSIHCE